MMREVRDQLRPAAESLGISVEDVRIRRTDLTKEVSNQTYERMKSERLAEAALIRARGSEAAQRIRAVADRQVVEIVSQAQKDADIARGEGDQQATRNLCQGLWRGPEVLRFLSVDECIQAVARVTEHDDGALPGFRILRLLPELERRGPGFDEGGWGRLVFGLEVDTVQPLRSSYDGSVVAAGRWRPGHSFARRRPSGTDQVR